MVNSRILKRRITKEVSLRREDNIAVDDINRAMGWIINTLYRDRIAINIHVVKDQGIGRDGNGRIFGGGHGVIYCKRWIINQRSCDVADISVIKCRLQAGAAV